MIDHFMHLYAHRDRPQMMRSQRSTVKPPYPNVHETVDGEIRSLSKCFSDSAKLKVVEVAEDIDDVGIVFEE